MTDQQITTHNFADLTIQMDDLGKYGVTVSVWFLPCGGCFEERTDRGSTETLSEHTYHANSEAAACYAAMQGAA